MDKTLIKRLIVEYQRLPQEINFIKRDIALSNNLNYVLVGLRRSGKSYLLYQKINDLIADILAMKSYSSISRTNVCLASSSTTWT